MSTSGDYTVEFDGLAQSYTGTSDRDLIASILLDAVEQSFQPHEDKSRRWLMGIYAQSLMILLDISPEAALEHLHRKWRRIDDESPRPAPGERVH